MDNTIIVTPSTQKNEVN